MQPQTFSQKIDLPVGAVFEYLADVANFSEFTGPFLSEWRMTREETYGLGAGGRFREKLPFDRFGWGDLAIVEFSQPRLIVLAGRCGKYNRIRTLVVFQLAADDDSSTTIELTIETHPVFPSDKLLDAVGRDRARRRGWRKSLRRLAMILEQNRDRGPRATIAGGARKPATGLRL